jgi:uncharacterized protein
MGTGEAGSIEFNKAVVRSFFDRMSAGDIDGGFELIAPGATWFSLGSRQHSDALAMKPMIERVYSSILDAPIQQNVLIVTAEENRVAVVTEGHAVTIDGVNYDNMYHFLFELEDGLIKSLWEFNDTAHVNAVLRRGDRGSLGLTPGNQA